MPANRTASLVAREGLGGPYVLLTFRHAETAREARPGQFVMIKAGESAEPPLRRPFSILEASPERETFGLFVKAIGPGSRALAALAVGGPAQCLGPLGHPFAPPEGDAEALMIGGGYGVAPFSFLGAELLRRGSRAPRLFYGGRTTADLPLLERLRAQGLDVVPATEDGTTGVRGRVTLPLEQHLDSGSGPSRLYACGPEAMMHAVATIAARRRLPAEVSLDPWMGCGVGTCLGCVVKVQRADDARWKYKCACTEGPVFDASCVVWPGESVSHARKLKDAERAPRPSEARP
jgi:dihydroorotate dehydrogenase electron transfer subunit